MQAAGQRRQVFGQQAGQQLGLALGLLVSQLLLRHQGLFAPLLLGLQELLVVFLLCLLLAQGQSLQQAVESLGHVAEGVYSARTVVQRAMQLGVDMPIASAVVALLDGRLAPQRAVAELMGRGPVSETG